MHIEELLHRGIEEQFKDQFGSKVHFREPLSAHGSDRNIIRLRSDGGVSAIGIVHNDTAENKAFVEFTFHFRKFCLKVPTIYKVSDDLKYYLMEDLGDTTFARHLNHRKRHDLSKEQIDLYKNIIVELLKFQIEAGCSIDYGLCYQYNEFGERNIDADMNYFKERFLHIFYKSVFDESRLNADLDCIKERVLSVPAKYFLYRDFQSRNIMLKDNELYFIDYQSGRRGALQYDIASLLYESKANIPQVTREILLDYYIERASEYVTINKSEFVDAFWYFALVRIMQAMGAYGYLGFVKGKEKFLGSIPYAIKNINLILNKKIGEDELTYLRNLFKEMRYVKA